MIAYNIVSMSHETRTVIVRAGPEIAWITVPLHPLAVYGPSN